jgi:hypothetical protein
MNLTVIIHAWENNVLPKDLDTLLAYKKEIDLCENHAFEAWRNTTNKTMGNMFVNEQLLYAEISEGIQSAIKILTRQLDYKKIKDKPLFTLKSTC